MKITLLLILLFAINSTTVSDELNYSRLETISFSVEKFSITGNLYFPNEKLRGIIIWIHGDGPNKRTSTFPGNKFFNSFLNNGYGYFRYDKPGNGDSKGVFTNNNLFQDRAKIVSSAIDALKKNYFHGNMQMGLVGSSQAGYVIPLVLNKRDDIDFMIGLSLPAMNSKEQWAYLLKMQMICEGYPEQRAEEFRVMHLAMMNSQNKQEFLEYAKYFQANTVNLSSINGYDENFGENVNNWWPLDWAAYQSFDPMEMLVDVNIPVLSIYGDKDTQVNPTQGAAAYRKCLASAPTELFEVVVLPETDHNMMLAETGCLSEQRAREKWVLNPELPKIIDKWLSNFN